ncbi:MAG: hypothetical protein WB992_12970, partial [Bryobacteraceae bacterium]
MSSHLPILMALSSSTLPARFSRNDLGTEAKEPTPDIGEIAEPQCGKVSAAAMTVRAIIAPALPRLTSGSLHSLAAGKTGTLGHNQSLHPMSRDTNEKLAIAVVSILLTYLCTELVQRHSEERAAHRKLTEDEQHKFDEFSAMVSRMDRSLGRADYNSFKEDGVRFRQAMDERRYDS